MSDDLGEDVDAFLAIVGSLGLLQVPLALIGLVWQPENFILWMKIVSTGIIVFVCCALVFKAKHS